LGVVEAIRLAALRHGPMIMGAIQRRAPWKIIGTPGKGEVLLLSNPKAVVMKGLSQAVGRSRPMALEPGQSASRDPFEGALRALDPSR